MTIKTNFFRTAALCIALCATSMSMRAADNLQELIFQIQAKQAELKNLMTSGEAAEQLQAFYNQLGDTALKLFTFRGNSIFGRITEDDVNTVKAVLESIDITQLKLIAEASSAIDEGKAKNALDTLQWFMHKCTKDVNAYYLQMARKAAREKFIADLSSWTSYTAAWDALCTTEGLQEKAAELWNNHRPAVAGAAIVIATTAAITTCIVYRNKIKAGLSRLFGSSTPAQKQA